MAHETNRDGSGRGKQEKAGSQTPEGAEDLFNRAAQRHQHGDAAGASILFQQIISLFPASPRAELAKTLLAGIRKEKTGTLWSSARDARSKCDVRQAVQLYEKIIHDDSGGPEAVSARSEIATVAAIQQLWNAALNFQSQGSETKALQLYQQIVEQYPGSPEAENAGLFVSIIHQNQLMPRGEVTQDFKFEKISPESLVSHLLAHKFAVAETDRDQAEGDKGAEQTRKIDTLWNQAKVLEQDGSIDEAVMLYTRIIEMSAQGYRVRDARYRIEKIKETRQGLLRSYEKPDAWGLAQDHANPVVRIAKSPKVLVSLAAVLAVIAASVLFYHASRPPSWLELVDQAKRSIVVVRTDSGAGTGFLISSNGQIITNAQVIGKSRSVEVRLYSGTLKKAEVVRTGTKLLDVALLKIDGLYEQYLPLADGDECREGMEIRMIGAPSGIEYFITQGIVSHCNLEQDGVRYIQTDSGISVGNSGGPCLNNQGKVIGLSTPIFLNNDVKSLNIILPQSVIKDFMAGRLTALEESLIKKEEEQTRALEDQKRQMYTTIENIDARLQQVVSSERAAYLKKVSAMLNRRQITSKQADEMVEQVNHGISWSVSMSEWVHSLAVEVAKQELSEQSAVTLIKEQHKLR